MAETNYTGLALRICITSGTYQPDVGGPPTYLAALARELVERGHSLSVVTHGRAAIGYPYPISRIPRQLPTPVRLALFSLATVRAGRKADLLFVNDYGLPPMVANLVLRKPLVLKIVGDFAWEYAVRHRLVPTGLDIEQFQRQRFGGRVQWLRLLQRWYARRADIVITPSRYLANLVESWGVPRELLRVVCNAAPPEQSRESAPECSGSSGWSPEDHVVVTVARLAPWKGIDVLIEAMIRVRRQEPSLRLLIVGDGDDRTRLERLGEPLADSARFVGQTNRAKALALIERSSIVTLCSAYEGLSHVLLEAMGAGKPIIASTAGGNPELIRDGENGLLVPYGDVEALERALLRLARNRELASRLGAQAREDSKAHSWPALVDNTLAVFREAIAMRR